MKSIKVFISVVILTLFSVSLTAQTNSQSQISKTKTETFKVWGACGMCKSRIEKTVMTEGAASASWDLKTQMLTVAFDPSRTSKDALSKKLASVGHDTEKYKAPDDVYAKLPGCCHYDRAK
jgi:periplasmic mercuric ion binding protein